MPQENGHRSARHSSRSSPLRTNDNQNDNGTDKIRLNREIKERGYYSELATVNPDSTFEVKLNLFVFFSNKILLNIFRKLRLVDKHQLHMMMFYEKHFVCRIQLEVFKLKLSRKIFIFYVYFSKYL
jgi:hypothetical protein